MRWLMLIALDMAFAPRTFFNRAIVLTMVASLGAAASLPMLAMGCGGSDSSGGSGSPDASHSSLDSGVVSAPEGGGLDAAPVDGTNTALFYGANVDPAGGVTFRVWAPHAIAARVVGDFPEASVAMTPAAAGSYAAHIAGAKDGSHYTFEFDSPSDGEAGATIDTVQRVDPYCREVSLDQKTCTVRAPSGYAWPSAAPFVRPAREKAIVYEMHVGGITEGGTLNAARAKLADLADLGVTVVELMPVQAFGGTAKGWGYNPHLWMAPKPDYGSADDLRAFVAEAHRLGLAVWIDYVVNHYDGWSKAPLRCFDGYCPPEGAGIYFFGQGPYANTDWGPRPDYSQRAVADMFVAAAEQWLTEYRGDGFRWDSTANIRALDGSGSVPGGKELLMRANDRIHQLGGTSVAEDWKGLASITSSTTPPAGSDASNAGYGFDAQWDGFGWNAMAQLVEANDAARDMGVVASALTGGYGGDPFARVLWLETHDTVGNGGARLPVRIDSAAPASWATRKRVLLGGTLLMTTPGVPMLFMGEEFLATGGFTDPPTPLETPSAAGQKVRAFYKDVIALRRSLDDLSSPTVSVFHRNDTNKVIGFARGKLRVVMNFKNKAYTEYDVGVPSAGPWKILLNTESTAYGDDFGAGQTGSVTAVTGAKDGEAFSLPLALAPYSAMVLSAP